ncbi:glycerol kinase GlpK [Hyphococcus luteus]|uniref:Glycerol kinase n=1 Tax=Hyphococcus luteus TaxID=2058213 RepID=A0A2S7K4S4_9PROT|nr:glycerol kinase GlpK [Marinicaulis flavus]PQA87481.1 glycerol kinase [Marinicaulis flavus]
MSEFEPPYILAIDQGTTSSRAIVFDSAGAIVAVSQAEFPQHYPQDGWVEHDPEDIWKTTLETARKAFLTAEKSGEVVAVGVTNQRETTIVWDRETGAPVYNAIVWQDRRTGEVCERLREEGAEPHIAARTGLILDPYFSATKAAWILDTVDDARARAEAGELAFGTVDSFLIWRLTGGKTHATDATNACRTSLYNIHENQWDDALLEKFRVPRDILPDVRDCADDYGMTDPELFGRALPICGVAGDQQAAAFGQACFAPGDIKSTYGTGCFVLINTGDKPLASQNKLLSTIAYRLDGETTYSLEGSIFIAGAAVQWLRDELQIIKDAAETAALAESIETNNGVYLVPAFTGLGAPHWAPDARALITGLTRGAGRAEIARAALESVVYQTADLMTAIARDGADAKTLRVDGGMVANDWLMQFLADILGLPVERPKILETTALGAAYLAGLKAGIFQDTEEIAERWRLDARFQPAMAPEQRARNLAGWADALRRTLV